MQPPMCRSGNHKDQRGQPFTWCEPATTSLERVQSSPTFFPPFMMKKASRTAGEWCDPLPEMAGPSSRGPRGPSPGAGSPGNCPRAHHIGFKSPDICSLRCGPEIRQHNANAFPRSWLDGCQGKALPVPWDSYPLLVPKDSMPTCSRMLEARSSEVSETAFSALAGVSGDLSLHRRQHRAPGMAGGCLVSVWHFVVPGCGQGRWGQGPTAGGLAL